MHARALDDAGQRRAERPPRAVGVPRLDPQRQPAQPGDGEAQRERLALLRLVAVERALDREPARAERERDAAPGIERDEPEGEGEDAERAEHRRRRTSSTGPRASAARADHRAGTSAARPRRSPAAPPRRPAATGSIRWASTGTASAWTSSGSTYSRPLSAARARAAPSSCSPARGLAPVSAQRVPARGLQERDDVGQQRLARPHRLHLLLGGEQLAQRAGALDAAARAARAAARSPGVRRIPERHAREEPVQLRGRQAVGAVVADARVLRGDDHERPLERVGAPVDGHLQLLHRLQQAGLRLRRGAVELVDEHDVGEDRAGVELERLRCRRARSWRRGCRSAAGRRSPARGRSGRRRLPATVRASCVLPTPGRSSSSRWPPASSVLSTTSSVSSAICIGSRIAARRRSPNAATSIAPRGSSRASESGGRSRSSSRRRSAGSLLIPK